MKSPGYCLSCGFKHGHDEQHRVWQRETHAFGAPTIPNDRLTTAAIYGRFLGGDSILAIVRDYNIGVGVAEDAIRYEAAFRARVARARRRRGWKVTA